MFNTTFNNILVISQRPVLLVEETEENHGPADKLYHIMLYRVHLAWAEFELTTLVVIGTDCIGSYKSTTILSRPRRPLTYIAVAIVNFNYLYFVLSFRYEDMTFSCVFLVANYFLFNSFFFNYDILYSILIWKLSSRCLLISPKNIYI